VSKQSGPIVFAATAEMANSMNVFKAGSVYVAHLAAAVAFVDPKSSPTKSSRTTKKTTKKKVTKKKVTKKKAKKKAKKVTKKATKKVTKKKAKKTIRPEMIVKFVRKNEGCNMTDIEGHTNLPQPTIRRILNAARESGEIRTEGQRRGLRYFVGAPANDTTDGGSTG